MTYRQKWYVCYKRFVLWLMSENICPPLTDVHTMGKNAQETISIWVLLTLVFVTSSILHLVSDNLQSQVHIDTLRQRDKYMFGFCLINWLAVTYLNWWIEELKDGVVYCSHFHHSLSCWSLHPLIALCLLQVPSMASRWLSILSNMNTQ